MGTQWTKEQSDVIQLRNCNLLVSAAAGSGKTAVLVERIVTMLTDTDHPVDIDQLLIVTFTNAAAGEMKERIRMAIDKRLEEDLDEETRIHLQKQISLLGNAQISTIHSFCQYVIRNYFHVIDLDPNFRIADEGELKLLCAEVMEKLLEESYEKANPDFLQLSESVATGKDDKKLEIMIDRIYRFSMSFPDPHEWLLECMRDYQVKDTADFERLTWVKLLVTQVQSYVKDIKNQMEYALKLTRDPDGPHMYEKIIENDMLVLADLEKGDTYQSFYDAFSSMQAWKRLSGKADDTVSPVKTEQVKDIREKYKKRVDAIYKDYFFSRAEEVVIQMNGQEEIMHTLLMLVSEYAHEYSQEKRRRNICDFNDLEHLALEILKHEEVAEELSLHYHEIMIDEYQDSNMVQEILLRSVSKEKQGIHNIFMVGDVKQSIYRFRLARPELFMEKFDTYSLEEGDFRRIDLHKNFRSRGQVLESVNDIFEKIMLKDLGNVAYDDAARLNTGAVFPPAEEKCYTSEICVLEPNEDELSENEENEKELEARMIGIRILSLLKEQQVWDKEQNLYRPAQFGDIVILLRTSSNWSESFVKTLQGMGIPAFAGSRTGYFSAPEVQIILAYLKILDNPCQDIPLTAVLHSPIGNIDGQKLSDLRCDYRDMPFWKGCMESDKLKEFYKTLNLFRRRASYTPVHELLRQIYDELGYADYAAAMPGGEQRIANLNMLIEKAVEFEKGSYHGLYNFIRYIENLHKYEVDFGEADILSGETNMVRIMTIHKSKGLEFPIVFVAGMGKTMNQMDARESLVMHADFGIAMETTDPVLRVKRENLFRNILRKQIKNETLGEELRILYVALTRAKEKLILTGVLKNAEKKLDQYAQKLPGKAMSFSDRADAATYFDWILPVILQMKEGDSLNLKEVRVKDLILEEKYTQKENARKKEYWKMLSPDEVVNKEAYDKLKNQMEFCYPYSGAVMIPSKVSVSELKRMHYAQPDEETSMLYQEKEKNELIPEFLKENKTVSGAARGTIYHKVMECMNFDNSPEEELQRLVGEGILTEEECKAVSIKKLELFQNSSLGKRMKDASLRGELFREQQFVMEEAANRLNEAWTKEESVLIQGIIDAYFIEDDEIVLVDYKTDIVKNQDASSLYEKYKVQLDCYRIALERLTKKRVKEMMLYSFYLNEEISGDI